jgi:hypothetical protein
MKRQIQLNEATFLSWIIFDFKIKFSGNKKDMKPFHIDRELEGPILFNPIRTGVFLGQS